MNLLLTLPYCTKDADLLKKCLSWMADLQLEGYAPHSCLLVADSAVAHEIKTELNALAKPLFAYTETMIVRVPKDKEGWPLGPNFMFAAAARQIAESCKLPWFWFEPDAVPLKRGWLDAFARAYAESPKRFMGALIPAENQPDMPPVHLAGCAIYDAQAYAGLQPFTVVGRPFDIAAAPYTVPRSVNTPLLQHFWGKPDLAPTFRLTKSENDPENMIPLGWLRPDAMAFHRCKDGTLIDLLRTKRNTSAMPQAIKTPDPVPDQPVKRGPGRPRKIPAPNETEPATAVT